MAAHPAREVEASSDLLVYGYLRAEEVDESEIAALRAELTRFCAAHGYRLGVVFCDRGVPGDATARTGFTGLLDVLRLPEAHGVVVPALGHLSSHELVRVALLRMVKRTGAQLIVVGGATGITASGELDGDARQPRDPETIEQARP